MKSKSTRKWKRRIGLLFIFLLLLLTSYEISSELGYNIHYTEGEKIDSLNHVIVYYNGSTGNVFERNTTKDNYNLGLKYQCVEFVKRYYYEHLHHKMPNPSGNAIDFFDKSIKDGKMNAQRGLIQYTNNSISKPKISDLVVLNSTMSNQFGHVAIISNVTDDEVELIQQNCGGRSRVHYDLEFNNGKWFIDNDRILGWLRIKN